MNTDPIVAGIKAQARPDESNNRTKYALSVDWPATGSICQYGDANQVARHLAALSRRLDENWLFGAPVIIEIREAETNAIRYW